MSKALLNARDDADAILASLGVLASFAHQAAGLANFGAMFDAERVKSCIPSGIGETVTEKAAKALKIARERLDTLLNDFGDYFNNGDACSATMATLTAPVYEVMQKRRNGVTLDD